MSYHDYLTETQGSVDIRISDADNEIVANVACGIVLNIFAAFATE